MQRQVKQSVVVRVVPFGIGVRFRSMEQVELVLEKIASSLEGGGEVADVYWSEDVDVCRVRNHFPEIFEDCKVCVGCFVQHCG